MNSKLLIRKFTKGKSESLTLNFRSHEFDCPCTDEDCTDTYISMPLAFGLQILREKTRAPIHINSGFRCKKHNAEVGGALNSYHQFGSGADIISGKLAPWELYVIVDSIPVFDQGGVILYPKHLHVDDRGFRFRKTVKG